MALVGGHAGIQVGTVDVNVALGAETVGHVLLGIALQFHAHPDNPLFVTKQSLHFFPDKRFQ